MARGKKKHLKRLAAPRHWMLSKLDGIYAIKPRSGPHNAKECIPISNFLRHKLRYALIGKEVVKIVKRRQFYVNGRIITDHKFPLGLMDIISIPKTGENFRLILDCRGRFYPRRIEDDEAEWTLVKCVKKFKHRYNRVNFLAHNGWHFGYPNPEINVNDSVKVMIKDKQNPEKQEVIKFKAGCEALCTGGRNKGRIGIVMSKTKIPAGQDIVKLKDSQSSVFSTQLKNLFVIGDGKNKALVGYDGKRNGIRRNLTEDRLYRIKLAKGNH